MTDSLTYICAHCGVTFVSEHSEEEAHAESLANWGTRGDAPGMAVVCDDCYRAFMAWYEQTVRAVIAKTEATIALGGDRDN